MTRKLLMTVVVVAIALTSVISIGTAEAHGGGSHGEGSGGDAAGGDTEPPVTFDVKEALAELEDQGIVLRDPDRGLIDFRALHSGREVLLCWQLGEENLEWWHLPEDGFAGRRPLPLPPEL